MRQINNKCSLCLSLCLLAIGGAAGQISGFWSFSAVLPGGGVQASTNTHWLAALH